MDDDFEWMPILRRWKLGIVRFLDAVSGAVRRWAVLLLLVVALFAMLDLLGAYDNYLFEATLYAKAIFAAGALIALGLAVRGGAK